MRVDLNVGSAAAENSAQPNLPAHSQTMQAGAASEEDQVFSSGEAGVSTLSLVALHTPEVRQAKIEALREQISSGNYQVSPHQIAASILDQLRTSRPNGS